VIRGHAEITKAVKKIGAVAGARAAGDVIHIAAFFVTVVFRPDEVMGGVDWA
jgi:hypothetical protein